MLQLFQHVFLVLQHALILVFNIKLQHTACIYSVTACISGVTACISSIVNETACYKLTIIATRETPVTGWFAGNANENCCISNKLPTKFLHNLFKKTYLINVAGFIFVASRLE